jgi:ribose transport system permease protein
VVVGGTSLTGGRGGVVNSLIGTLIVTVINNALVLLGVNPYVQQAAQGIIIITAVAVSVPHGKNLILRRKNLPLFFVAKIRRE